MLQERGSARSPLPVHLMAMIKVFRCVAPALFFASTHPEQLQESSIKPQFGLCFDVSPKLAELGDARAALTKCFATPQASISPGTRPVGPGSVTGSEATGV